MRIHRPKGERIRVEGEKVEEEKEEGRERVSGGCGGGVCFIYIVTSNIKYF